MEPAWSFYRAIQEVYNQLPKGDCPSPPKLSSQKRARSLVEDWTTVDWTPKLKLPQSRLVSQTGDNEG